MFLPIGSWKFMNECKYLEKVEQESLLFLHSDIDYCKIDARFEI